MFLLPVVLVMIFAAIMGLVGFFNIGMAFSVPYYPVISALLVIGGFWVIILSGASFKNHGTTVNPARPEDTTTLVTTGLYAYSRNPMYIGFLFWLLACVIWAGSLLNLIFLPIYIVLVNKLYIIPEEQMLERQFKQHYQEYRNKVRRWI